MATVVKLRANGSSPNTTRYTSTESLLASGASGNNSLKDFCVSPKLLLRVLAESSTFTTSVPPWPLIRTGIPRGLGLAPVKLGAPISCWKPSIERVPVEPMVFPMVMTSLPAPALIVKVELALPSVLCSRCVWRMAILLPPLPPLSATISCRVN